jgi:hypothetical protein
VTTSTTRIVLHDANWNDYLKLYAEMSARGFTDEIRADRGVHYKMPDGEYDLPNSLLSAVQIRDLAATAASATGRKYQVFVTAGEVRTWVGLPEVASMRRA